MEKKKKITLLIIIGIFIIALAVALYFVIRAQTNPYPKEPITQESLSSTTQTIALNDTQIEKSDGHMYTISKTVMLDKVESFVQTIDAKLEQTIGEEGSYYEWRDGDNYVIYELEQNTVIFSVKSGIVWDEASINGYSFSQFASKYFQKNWTYSLPVSDKQGTGETIYYAKRTLDNLNLETIFNKQATDYIATKDGKILYGKILLTEFIKSEDSLPLISSSGLAKYINLKGYPKEVYPAVNTIQSSVLSGIDYLTDDFDNIMKTLSNCRSTASSIIYLYKSLDQENLTPVYRLDLQCEIEYKDTQYTIPAIGYVNAIDPEYVSTAE